MRVGLLRGEAAEHRVKRALTLLALQVPQAALYAVRPEVDYIAGSKLQKAACTGYAEYSCDQREQQHKVGLGNDSGRRLTEHRDRQRESGLMLRHIAFEPGHHAVGPRFVERTKVTHVTGTLDYGPTVGLEGLVRTRVPQVHHEGLRCVNRRWPRREPNLLAHPEVQRIGCTVGRFGGLGVANRTQVSQRDRNIDITKNRGDELLPLRCEAMPGLMTRRHRPSPNGRGGRGSHRADGATIPKRSDRQERQAHTTTTTNVGGVEGGDTNVKPVTKAQQAQSPPTDEHPGSREGSTQTTNRGGVPCWVGQPHC